MAVKLPVALVIALIAAIAGGAISYVAIPSPDPEMKALLQRQVELAEREALAREEALDATRRAMSFDGALPTEGRPMEIRRPAK